MDIKRKFFYDPSLVLYLPLYELDGVSFASRDAYGHLCTVTPISSGPTWGLQGRTFDGTDDKITIPTLVGTALDILGDMTVIIWLKPSRLQNGNKIICRGLSLTDGYYMGLDGNAGGVYIVYSQAGACQAIVTGDGALSLNVFSCIAFTKLGTVGQGYVNGDTFGSSAAVTNPVTSNRTFKLGRYDIEGADNFQGTIGEVFIYNRALSLAEVQHNYLGTKWRYQ